MPFIISEGFKKYSEEGGKAEKIGPTFSAIKRVETPIYPYLPNLKNVKKQVTKSKVTQQKEKIHYNDTFADMKNFYTTQ